MSMIPPAASYRAVMRCPSCGSEHTEVAMVPSKVLRDGTPVDVDIRWDCQVCKRSWKPPCAPSDTVRVPILMCARCQRPAPHRFEGTRERRWREPIPAPQNALKIFVEVYVCVACGESREYGIAPSQVAPRPASENSPPPRPR